MSSAAWIQLRAQITAAVKFHLNRLGLSPSTLITGTSQSFSLFHVDSKGSFSGCVHRLRFQGGFSNGIKAVSQSAVCHHTCVIPSSPARPASSKPSLSALKSCHTFFMIVPVTRLRIGSGIQLAAEEGDKCNTVDISRETGADLTINGPSETGLSSSISNQFVSAAIVTDKQSAGNII